MSHQEMFETALRSIIKQGAPGSDGMLCHYHTIIKGEERRCSLGFLLGDDVTKVLAGANAYKTIDERWKSPPSTFLVDLQQVHDRAAVYKDKDGTRKPRSNKAFMKEFIERMKDFAASKGLTFPSDI